MCSTSSSPFFLPPTSPTTQGYGCWGSDSLQPPQPQWWSLDLGWANVGPCASSPSGSSKVWAHAAVESIGILPWNVRKWGGNTVSGSAFPRFVFRNLLAYKPYCLLKFKIVQAGCSSCMIERPPSNTRTLAEWEIPFLSLSPFTRMFIEGTLCARPEIGWWANIRVTDILIQWDYGLLGRASIQWLLKINEFQVFHVL